MLDVDQGSFEKIASQDAPDAELIEIIGRDFYIRERNRTNQILNQPDNVISEYQGFRKLVCDEIGYVESITKKCKHLKNLLINDFVRNPEDGENSGQWTKSMIDQISPKLDMKVLHITFEGIVSPDFLSYIIRKFPKLEEVQLTFDDHYELDQALEINLVRYLANIQNLAMYHSKIPSEDAWKLIEAYIKSFDIPQPFGIEIKHRSPYTDLDTLTVNRRQSGKIQFGIHPSSCTPKNESMDFFTKYGQHFTSIAIGGHKFYDDTLDFNDTSSDFYEVDGRSFYDILKHCPKVNSIGFEQCVFRYENWENTAECSPKKLKRLSLTSNLIHQDFLPQLSNLFYYIETIGLQKSTFCNDEGHSVEFEMDMRLTSSKCVDLGNINCRDSLAENTVCLHINTATHGDLYYVLDGVSANLQFKLSNQLEYENMREDTIILNNFSLRCHDLQEVTMSLDYRKVTLKL